MDNNLIFDIGMNHGEDSEFYLCKGFHVIAIECNPNLVDDVSARLAPYIKSNLNPYKKISRSNIHQL